MPIIELQTYIQAPKERCFDLSRSIDLHKLSLAHTKEEAVAGVTSGLIGLNQEVTWKATHFGIPQKLTVKIDRFEPPLFFRDSMVKGTFKRFHHDHKFETSGDGCLMRDTFNYDSPFGVLGRIVDVAFLKAYMTRLLKARNSVIKSVAESDEWRKLLKA
jgi:ligand-binding SRPBCC domain-containing protein